MQFCPLMARLRPLGFKRVEIHYCKFATLGDGFTKKPTHLWTNSKTLYNTFKGGAFKCSPSTPCQVGTGRHVSVRAEAGQGTTAREFAQYPRGFLEVVGMILYNDACDGR